MKTQARADIRIDAVFDLETQDWTTFVCGGVYYADGAYQAYRYEREGEMFAALMGVQGPDGKRGHVWSHNGGRFDMKWVLDYAMEVGVPCEAVSAGANIIMADVGPIRLYDTKALTKISLEELTKGASVAKEKLGLPCIGKERGCPEEPEECKGYCAIRRDMPAKHWARVLAYMEADCRSLYEAMQRIREYAAENDLDLAASVGSAAWKNARRLLGLPPAKPTSQDHKYTRRAYYGGRVQIFRPRSVSGYEYDVNSMYPSRLAQERVPIGKPRWVYGDNSCRFAFSRFPGVYTARVHVPDMHVPPLPVRLGTRICYPTGTFCGTWTRDELTYAVECCGVKLLGFVNALCWPTEVVLFTPWVEKLFQLRSEALGWDGKPDKKGPLGTFLKFYANSLTGKFGSRPDTSRLHIGPSDEDLLHKAICKEKDDDEGPACKNIPPPRKCKHWKAINLTCDIYTEPQWFIQPCAHVEWVAYLTAQARVEWHRQATSDNGGWDLVYGDTDSNFTESPRTRNIGPGLGQWEEGKRWRNFEAFAPKVYRLETDSGPKVKAKGLRLARRPETAEAQLRSGVAVGKDAVVGFRAGARLGKFFQTDVVKRTVNVGYGDRVLNGDTTRAPTYKEAVRKWAPKGLFSRFRR